MLCRQCQYDLRRLERDVCPECGQAFDRDKPETYLKSAPPNRVLFYCLVLAVVVPAAGLWVWIGMAGLLLITPIVSAVSGLLFANYFERHDKSPRAGGAWGGIISICLLIPLAHAPYVIEEAFFYQGPYPEPFYEEGLVMEVFVFPALVICMLSPIAALTGWIAAVYRSRLVVKRGQAGPT
ncbi:MAG: hypothetical protein ACIAXF_15505 [Phycisphaerales bacterium JB063]